MGHPFFDASTFPSWREDAKAFVGALLEVCRAQAAGFEVSWLITIYKRCSANLPLIAVAGVLPARVVEDVLQQLVVARVFKAFCEELLTSAGLGAVHERVRAVVRAEGATETTQLSEKVLFLDRESLRARLDVIAAGGNEGVLLVRGEPGSGKSWTRRLVEHVAKSQNDECIYLGRNHVGTVGDVLRDLFNAIAGRAVPESLTTPHAAYRDMCSDLLGVAQAQQKRWWIIADDLGVRDNADLMDRRIREFFEQFVVHMTSPVFRQRFCLVLLDYPEGKPTKWEDDVWIEDRTAVSDIRAPVVAEFLAHWTARKGLNAAPEEFPALADGVLARAEAAREKARREGRAFVFLRCVHDELPPVLADLQRRKP